MTPTKPIIKYALYAILVAAIVVSAVLIFKNKNSDQEAAVYKTGTLQTSTINAQPISTTITPSDKINSRVGAFPKCNYFSSPWVHVTSPNGGEVYTPGQSITVTWTSCKIPTNDPVSIVLEYNNPNIQGGITGSILLTSSMINGHSGVTQNDGTEVITLPDAQTIASKGFGTFYRIGVNSVNNIYDNSDNLFTITDTNIIPTLVSATTSVTTGSSANDDVGTFTINFTVEAVGGDVYIHNLLQRSLLYRVERAGVATTSGISSAFIEVAGNGTTANGNYEIQEGETSRFQLVIARANSNIGDAGLYRAIMSGIKWSLTDSMNPTQTHTLNPAYMTSYISLN